MSEIWKVIWGLSGAFVAWLLTIERRIAARLTIDKHEKICDKRYGEFKETQREQHQQNTETLQRIEYLIDSSNKESRTYREKMQTEIQGIQIQLAALKAKSSYGRSN